MKTKTRICLLICGMVQLHVVGAYELSTHAALSARAYERSTWFSGSGPSNVDLDLKNSVYPSVESGTASAVALIQEGAKHEDDNKRPLNHFYDPFYDRGLWVPLAQPSPRWVLESDLNYFSYRRLQEFFYAALVLPSKTERTENWGRVFEGLGHMIHHIQDMAQPQHVRNDAHYHNELIGDPSQYEFCTDDAIQNLVYGCGTPLLSIEYPPVALPRAANYWTTRNTDTIGRRRGLADFTNANFVSKDTNFRLLDGDWVVRAEDYPLPVPDRPNLRTLDELGAADVCERLRKDPRTFGDATRCEVEFYSVQVYDAYNGTASRNDRAASLSLFDQYLKLRRDGASYETDRLFTLNRFNYAAAHPYLISRAIGYSAGLIDHFFRGRLEFASAEAADGAISITVKNASGTDNAFGPGTFELFYDGADKTRKPLPIQSGAELGMAQFAPGAEHTFTVAIPDDLDLAAEKPFALVYTGIIGAEEAVAGLVFEAPQIHEGFLVRVNGNLPEGFGTDRLIYKSQGSWRLHPQTNVPRGGSVDWKGAYADGKATRLLTWSGPGRYGSGDLREFTPQIYRGGRPFVVAPAPVLGAALQQAADGTEWVVAICAVDERDVAFSRPAKRQASAALHDPQLAPDGWRYLGEFGSSDLRSRRASWLFNGSGTEAQTMRERKADGDEVVNGSQPDPGHLARLKVSLDLASASFAEIDNPPIRGVIRRRADYHCDTGGPRSRWSRTEVQGAHVVAVDYAGEREVVARILVESVAESNEGVTSTTDETRGNEIATGTDKWTLELGSIRLPLYEMQRSWRAEYATYWPEKVQLFTYAGAGETNASRAVLLTWDLRNESFLASTGHAEFESADRLAEDRTFTTSHNHRAHFVRQIALPGRSPVELNRTPVVEAPYSASHEGDPWQIVMNRDILGACGPTEREDDGVEFSVEFDLTATLATVPQVHYPSNMNVTSLATSGTDRAGNFFYSLRYRDGPGKPFFRISRLAGINVDTITGLTSASVDGPPYAPIVPN